jgi:outer membrane protein assembly factor BamB
MAAGLTGTTGCLRLQSDGESTPRESEAPRESSTPSETPSDGTSTNGGANEITLTETWTDKNGVDNIWTREGTFYYNDYNYAAEASHDDGVRWSAETTRDGVDGNLGADAFAADDSYVVFGVTPDEEHEDEGAHFHAYRRYDGERMWVAAAPSDGTHNLAAGATMVDDTAVLAVSDYGEGDERDPLVYGVDIETGGTRWQADETVFPPSYIRYVDSYDGDVYVGLQESVQTLAGDTGEAIETHDWYAGTYRLESLAQIHGNTLFTAWIDTLDAHPVGDNGVSWSNADLGRVYTTPVIDNSLVVVGTGEGNVYAFERQSGEIRWEASITNAVAAMETTGSHVWVGDTDIGLTAYDRETGSLVHRSTKPVNGDDIAVADGILLLGGDTATAYTID